MANFETVELIRAVMPNPYALDKRGYEYLFFKIPADLYPSLSQVRIRMDVVSGNTQVLINGYLDNPVQFAAGPDAEVCFPIAGCEAGENYLAYKGQIRIKEIEFVRGENGISAPGEIPPPPLLAARGDPVLEAAQFLFNSQIRFPRKSPFRGACYCIYDFDNQTHRMSNWVWNNAVVVNAMIALIKSDLYPHYRDEFKRLAVEAGNEYLAGQVDDRASGVDGALVSRYKNLGAADHPADCLVGPNDTSFSVKWALLPLYELTGESKYLEASRRALEWVGGSIRAGAFVPLDFNLQSGKWGDYTIIDTAFLPEGLEAWDRHNRSDSYKAEIRFFMDRFIGQFRLETGFYGQTWYPAGGVNRVIFSRGQGWAMEGLLAAYRATGEQRYLSEALNLALLMAKEQNRDGSWSYVLGYDGRPETPDKEGTGICEKATPILAYFFLEMYRMDPAQRLLLEAADRALGWCGDHIFREDGPGYGGIVSKSLNSGITGLPFLTVATGYANAFFILAKLLRRGL